MTDLPKKFFLDPTELKRGKKIARGGAGKVKEVKWSMVVGQLLEINSIEPLTFVICYMNLFLSTIIIVHDLILHILQKFVYGK